VKERLEQVALAAPDFAISLKNVGVFPNERSARVVWLGVDQGAPELTNLALRVQGELTKIGFLPEKRPFSAHLTIGRVRERLEDVSRILSRTYASRAFGVKRIALIRSILQPTGPIYEELAEFKLQPANG
jgi:RNA 2',3'-cyclic 3'-phosphodiesterase